MIVLFRQRATRPDGNSSTFRRRSNSRDRSIHPAHPECAQPAIAAQGAMVGLRRVDPPLVLTSVSDAGLLFRGRGH